MKPQEVQLTLIDKMILQSYRSMVEGLGNYLGEAYEIVLHSLEDFQHSVISTMVSIPAERSVPRLQIRH